MEGAGRYVLGRNAGNQAKLQAYLPRMVDLMLNGKKAVVTREQAQGGAGKEIASACREGP